MFQLYPFIIFFLCISSCVSVNLQIEKYLNWIYAPCDPYHGNGFIFLVDSVRSNLLSTPDFPSGENVLSAKGLKPIPDVFSRSVVSAFTRVSPFLFFVGRAFSPGLLHVYRLGHECCDVSCSRNWNCFSDFPPPGWHLQTRLPFGKGNRGPPLRKFMASFVTTKERLPSIRSHFHCQ